MEPGVDVVSGRRSAAAWLRRVGKAIKKFFGPIEPGGSPASSEARRRVAGPTCVWYGRAMFCLYLPEPFPGPGSNAQEVREIRRDLDLHSSPEFDDAVVGQLEELHRAA